MSEAPPMASRIIRAHKMKSLSEDLRNALIDLGDNVIDGRELFAHQAKQAKLAREYRKPTNPSGSDIA